VLSLLLILVCKEYDMKRLFPDWKLPKAIALVWPDKEFQYSNGSVPLQKFYEAFIKILDEKLPEGVAIIVYFIENKSVPDFIKALSKVQVKIYYESNDIWIRDFAPFWGMDGKKLYSVKGTYYPWYGDDEDDDESYTDDAESDDDLGLQIGGGEKTCRIIEVDGQEFVLDGGNFIHNGTGTGMCTNRIISDNESFFLEELEYTMCDALGLEKLIILPVEPGDDTGHIDGLVRYVNEDTVIVSDYVYEIDPGDDTEIEEEYRDSKAFVDNISGYLKSQGLSVKRISNVFPIEEGDGPVGSAVGNYLNFLRVGELIFVPQYKNKEENEAAIEDLIEAGFSREKIILVPGCEALAKYGGVLNCITTHIY
jgi:agmatine deiminase